MSDAEAERVHPGFAIGAGVIVVGVILEALSLYGPIGFVLVVLGAAFFVEGELRR